MPGAETNDASAHHFKAVFRALKHNKLRDPALRPYITAARMIPMRIDPFINLERVFFAGVPEAVSSEDGKRDDNYTDEEIKAYSLIIKYIPSYQKILSASVHDPALFELFVKEVATAATRSRTNDTSTIKSNIAGYILPSIGLCRRLKRGWHPLDPDTQRGWEEPQCARLLTPPRLFEKFCDDPYLFMENVPTGGIKIKAKEFGLFCYDEGVAYDPKNEFKGLFRSPLLVRAYRALFSSPLSAFNPAAKRGNKPSQAETHGITEVEPRGIAYAAVHVRMALSGVGWTDFHVDFHNETFFDNVVGMFERQPNSKWAKDTLNWWNSQVCLVRSKKNAKKRQPLSDDSDDELGNPVDRIQAQIAAAEGGDDEDEEDSEHGAVSKQQQSRQPDDEGSVTESEESEGDQEAANGWSDFGKGVGAYRVPEPTINNTQQSSHSRVTQHTQASNAPAQSHSRTKSPIQNRSRADTQQSQHRRSPIAHQPRHVSKSPVQNRDSRGSGHRQPQTPPSPQLPHPQQSRSLNRQSAVPQSLGTSAVNIGKRKVASGSESELSSLIESDPDGESPPPTKVTRTRSQAKGVGPAPKPAAMGKKGPKAKRK